MPEYDEISHFFYLVTLGCVWVCRSTSHASSQADQLQLCHFATRKQQQGPFTHSVSINSKLRWAANCLWFSQSVVQEPKSSGHTDSLLRHSCVRSIEMWYQCPLWHKFFSLIWFAHNNLMKQKLINILDELMTTLVYFHIKNVRLFST